MKKPIVTLLAVYLFFTFAFAQSWQQVQLIPSSEYTPGFLDGKFWGDTGIIVGMNGKLFHSNDFFQTYTIDSSYLGNAFWSMSFANREVGYITSCTVRGGMIKTTDGGTTWNPLPFGPDSGVCIGENVLFTSPDTGYTAWRESGYQMWYTFNGGQSWNYNSPLSIEGTYKIETVQDSFIYILKTAGISVYSGTPYLFRTSDYGTTWQNTFNTYPREDTENCDFHFIDDTTMILALDGAILKSRDAGFTFDTVMFSNKWVDHIGSNVRAISFAGHDTGYVAYFNGIYKTYDAGDTWVKTDFAFESPDQVNGNEITFIKAVSALKVLVGCFKGNIYKTETGGGVWADVKETEKVTQFTLYPNPTTNQLTIQTSAASFSFQILSTTGTLLIQSTVTQQPNFTVDVSTLPAGLYFLQLSDGKQRVVKKFVKE